LREISIFPEKILKCW